MKDIGNACIVFFGLMLAMTWLSAAVEKRAGKKGNKPNKKAMGAIDTAIVLLFLCSCLSGAAWFYEKWLAEPPKPQAVVIMDHSGAVIVEYENSGDDFSCSYDDEKNKVTVNVDGVKYTYINAIAKIVGG